MFDAGFTYPMRWESRRETDSADRHGDRTVRRLPGVRRGPRQGRGNQEGPSEVRRVVGGDEGGEGRAGGQVLSGRPQHDQR